MLPQGKWASLPANTVMVCLGNRYCKKTLNFKIVFQSFVVAYDGLMAR